MTHDDLTDCRLRDFGRLTGFALAAYRWALFWGAWAYYAVLVAADWWTATRYALWPELVEIARREARRAYRWFTGGGA